VNSIERTVQVPEDRNGPPARRVYYRGGGVQITERWFVAGDSSYAIAHLNRLRTGRGPLHPMVQTTAAVAVVFAVAFAASFELVGHNPAAWLGLAAVAVVPAVMAALGLRFQRRPYQIWADLHGETVLVFSTLDEKTYGHVCRALIRARESCPPAAPGGGSTVPAQRRPAA
jgi:Family of unknown function (DUF6232)